MDTVFPLLRLAQQMRSDAVRDGTWWSLDWESLDVNYRPPHVERLWRPLGEGRVFLHRIEPCDAKDALFHPHPWPSEMLVFGPGGYRMLVGAGAGTTRPEIVLDQLVEHSAPTHPYRYRMNHPDGWHAVIPVGEPVYTVMVTGRPWKRPIPRETVEVSGKLSPLSDERKRQMRLDFDDLWGPYLTHP